MCINPSLGGSNSLPISTSEEWSGARNCGSDGSVQVKCTKFNGKQFEKIKVLMA